MRSLSSMLCCLVQAISASMSEGDLTATTCTVGFVGADSSFTILSDADLEPHVAALKDSEDAPAGTIRLICPGCTLSYTDSAALHFKWQYHMAHHSLATGIGWVS